MIPVGIEVVVFDAVGTLIHPEPPAATVYAEVGRRFGGCHSVEVIAPRFAAAFAREEEADRAAGWRTSEDRESRRWRDIVASVKRALRACPEELQEHPVVLTQPDVRRFVRKLIETELPWLRVLSYSELLPEVSVKPAATATIRNL